MKTTFLEVEINQLKKKPLKQFFRHSLHAFKHFPVNFGIKIIVIKLPFFWYYFYMIIEAQF